MGHSEFWDEDFIFLRHSVGSEEGKLLFSSYFDSRLRPGALLVGGGGGMAVHSLMLTGESCTTYRDGHSIRHRAGEFSIGSRPYARVRVESSCDVVRKAFMVHANTFFHSVLDSMFGGSELIFTLRDVSRVEFFLDRIKSEMSGGQDECVLAGLWFALMHELGNQRASDPLPEKLRECLRFIDRHLGEAELTREAVARSAGIGLRTLNRRFEAYLHISPARYIVAQRLERARRMLTIPTFSVKEIAARTGFSDSNYFCRAFRAHFKRSPGSMR